MTFNDLSNSGEVNAVFGGKLRVWNHATRVLGAYFKNLLLRQFNTARSLAASDSCAKRLRLGSRPASVSRRGTPFGVTVFHVVLMRAEKKMIRVYAQWNIALVANLHPLWYWAMRQAPCDSMSGLRSSVPSNASVNARESTSRALPKPTVVISFLVAFFPEAVRRILSSARLAAKPLFISAFVAEKPLTASRTSKHGLNVSRPHGPYFTTQRTLWGTLGGLILGIASRAL